VGLESGGAETRRSNIAYYPPPDAELPLARMQISSCSVPPEVDTLNQSLSRCTVQERNLYADSGRGGPNAGVRDRCRERLQWCRARYFRSPVRAQRESQQFGLVGHQPPLQGETKSR
jgi:hypothetical protein